MKSESALGVATGFGATSATVLQTNDHYQSHGGGVSATLHQRFWVRYDDGSEHQIHLVNCNLPMRQGHRLLLIWWNDWLAAVHNTATGLHVNLVHQWGRLPVPPGHDHDPRSVRVMLPRLMTLPGLMVVLCWAALISFAITSRSWIVTSSVIPALLIPPYVMQSIWERRDLKRLQSEATAYLQHVLASRAIGMERA